MGELTSVHAHTTYKCRCGFVISTCLCKDETTKRQVVFDGRCDCKIRQKRRTINAEIEKNKKLHYLKKKAVA